MFVRHFQGALLGATVLSAALAVAHAATLPPASPLVTGRIDDSTTIALTADRPGALSRAQDQGVLAAGTALPHVWLALRRPADRQAALDKLVHDQQQKGAADYHHWLKPTDLRAYGPAQADIDATAAWLTRHNLAVNHVSPSGMVIDFAGTADAVATAFHTELHTVTLGGEQHIANVSPPSVPAALSPIVSGVTLSNFFPKPAMRRVTPSLTSNTIYGLYYAVAPADFSTIYNVGPLHNGTSEFGFAITGAGVTVAVVEQTEIQASDWRTFRRVFGLTGFAGTLKQINPSNCTSPGFTPDEGEAALDAEWASATAPAATIIEASCASAAPVNFGVETALQNLVEDGTTATIFSISYEGDEKANGYTFEQTWTNLLEEGAAEGIAIFVASGDNGVSADRNTIDSNGLFVNGLADSAYNVSVGGTDFQDTSLGENATYWSKKNSPTKGSALSYVPEIPWDNSCASSVLWKFEGAPNAITLCNDGVPVGQLGVGGSGSQSIFYAKPSWQLTTVPGVPNDGVRDQPDVSLFAANGLWAHFYVFCMSDPNEGGLPCKYGPSNIFNNAAGGTSFGSPAFAGIAALIQQVEQGPIGNLGPQLYTIAQAQFTSQLGLSQCKSALGNKISVGCAFNNITVGDISEPCFAGTPDCKTTANSTLGIGILGLPDGSAGPAYRTSPGYSLATGLGTVNVTNLLYNYSY